MRETQMNKLRVVSSAAVMFGVSRAAVAAPKREVSDIGRDLAKIRQATAKYHRVEVVEADGYLFYGEGNNPGGPDAFYVSFAAFFDGPPPLGVPGVLKLEQPEVLAYVKRPNGELRLASVFFFRP